jgi:hypothetical protein
MLRRTNRAVNQEVILTTIALAKSEEVWYTTNYIVYTVSTMH